MPVKGDGKLLRFSYLRGAGTTGTDLPLYFAGVTSPASITLCCTVLPSIF